MVWIWTMNSWAISRHSLWERKVTGSSPNLYPEFVSVPLTSLCSPQFALLFWILAVLIDHRPMERIFRKGTVKYYMHKQFQKVKFFFVRVTSLWRYTRRDTNISTEWSMTLLSPLSTKGIKKLSKKLIKRNACQQTFSSNGLTLRTPASGLFHYIFQWFSYRKISHFRVGRF